MTRTRNLEDDHYAWLKKLKAGDKVIVDSGGWGDNRYVATVEKVTPSGIIKLKETDKRTFSDTGYERGEKGRGYGGRCHLEKYTQEAVREILKKRMVSRLSHMGSAELEKLDYDRIKTAHDILFPPEEKKPSVD